jgi:hypothetical protein
VTVPIPIRTPPTEDRCEAVLMVLTGPNFYTPVRCVSPSIADCTTMTEAGQRILVSLCEEHARLIGILRQTGA